MYAKDKENRLVILCKRSILDFKHSYFNTYKRRPENSTFLFQIPFPAPEVSLGAKDEDGEKLNAQRLNFSITCSMSELYPMQFFTK